MSLSAEIRGVERHLVEQFFHDRVQPPRADVFGALVDERGEVRDAPDGTLGESQRHPFGRR